MDRNTFDSLGIRPGLRVEWGGKPYRLKSVDHRRGTCYIAPLNTTTRAPYVVEFARVEICEKQHPRKKLKSKKEKL